MYEEVLKYFLKNKNKIFAYTLIIIGVLGFLKTSENLNPKLQTVFSFAAATTKKEKKLPVYDVETSEKKIAISFDATWGAEKTSAILDILDEYGIKTTFFLCGYWIDDYPDKVKEIYARGHEIGNHSENHKNQSTLTLEKNIEEIQSVHKKIKDLIGVDMILFRPPFGDYNNTVIEALDSLGYYGIQWSVDSHDWMNKGVDYEINQVLNHKKLRNGAIILFHNDADDTLKALPTILKKLTTDGYKIVPVSELIYKDDFHINSEGTQIKNK